MSNEVTACGRIVKEEKTGRFIEVTLKPAFYKLPIDSQYDFLCKSRKDFLKETKRMEKLAKKKLTARQKKITHLALEEGKKLKEVKL